VLFHKCLCDDRVADLIDAEPGPRHNPADSLLAAGDFHADRKRPQDTLSHGGAMVKEVKPARGGNRPAKRGYGSHRPRNQRAETRV
jgi:hypothetical protein